MPGRFEFPLMMLLVVLLMAFVHKVHAAPVMQAAVNDVAIVLHDEACQIEAVGGEKYLRAQWITPNGAIEGCWGLIPVHPSFRVVVFYFMDKTIAAVPASMFTRVNAS